MDSTVKKSLTGLFCIVLLSSFALPVLGQSASTQLLNVSSAPTFPPEPVTGPFPLGTETVREDSPVDFSRPSDIIHEYTCYMITEPPVIDGEIDDDPVWNRIPWSVMTFWENNGYTEEFSIFSEQTNDNWTGFEDATAWWKMLWDGENIYVAIEVIDDMYNAPETPENPGDMHKWDCIQFGIHTLPPGYDEMTEDDMGCELGFGITDWNGEWEELFANWDWAGHPWANAQMQLADGDNASGNASTDGKAIHASVEETADYYIYRFEVQLTLDIDWQTWIVPGAVGRVTIMAMDHDTGTYEDVNWASGILGKDITRLGSVLWSETAPPEAAVKEDSPSSPSEFTLSQNYPNPFNPATTISFAIPQRETVTLSVYNPRGEKVATLIDQETKNAGHYSVSFDAKELANGLYFYRLQAGNQYLTRKMTLVK